jgi:hypothetical protein
MTARRQSPGYSRREFFKKVAGGVFAPYLASFPLGRVFSGAAFANDIFWVKNIPDFPFTDPEQPNRHLGLDSLLYLMSDAGLRFYRSAGGGAMSGPSGLIAAGDVVLIKVNAQWKYRGCTNSDLIRGLVQRILDHPDGFTGEVVIIENGQGRGSLNCDTSSNYSDSRVHANANDERHSFLYLAQRVFGDSRVSAFLLDPIRTTFIGSNDHSSNGYRKYENVSYPCFTTAGGRRVELREGIWQGNGHTRNLKLINVPVLKHHDTGGSEITASLKHFYGVVSMADGESSFRHYSGLGETCGKMMASVATPVLNIVDAIWVSHRSLTGFPSGTTFRANQVLASQDPVALDYWAAKYVLYTIDANFRHHPDFPGIDRWLTQARDTINGRGGLLDPGRGIIVDRVTKREEEMRIHAVDAGAALTSARMAVSNSRLYLVSAASAGETLEKTIEVSFSGGAPLTWQVAADVDWLACSPISGAGSGLIAVQASAHGLPAGKHAGHIIISSAGAVNSPQYVPVLLNLLEPGGRGRPGLDPKRPSGAPRVPSLQRAQERD